MGDPSGSPFLKEIVMDSLEEKAEFALQMVEAAPTLAIDSETTGVNWLKSRPVGWAFSDGVSSVYIPIRHGGGGNLNDPCGGPHRIDSPSGEYRLHSFEMQLSKMLNERHSRPIVGHHMKFDMHQMVNVGIDLTRATNVHCTMNMEALLDEYSRSFALESVAKKYGVTTKKGEEMYGHLSNIFVIPNDKNAMSHFWRTAGIDPVVDEYATADARATAQIFQKQCKAIAKQDLGYVEQLERYLMGVLVRMERRGIPVDTYYLNRLPDMIMERIADAMYHLPEGFNVRSPKQVKEFVSKARTDWPVTEKGNPSFTKQWLSSFHEGRLIVEVREWRHLLSSFVDPLIKEHVFNGRVHTTFNQNRADAGGVVSGRLSCFGPNMMAIPKHNKEAAKLLRRVFVPEPGRTMWEMDYSQIEPRMYAHFTQDNTLVEGFKSGMDTHGIVAERLNKDRDTIAKRMNMGLFTGMFPKSFAEHMGLPVREAKKLWDDWHRLFPEIRPFQEWCKREMAKRGYVSTILRRRGRLQSHRYAYRGASKVIQGSVADLLKYKMLELDRLSAREGYTFDLMLSVHDSIIFQVYEGDNDTPKLIKETMEKVDGSPFFIDIPLKVDSGHGADWAEVSGL